MRHAKPSPTPSRSGSPGAGQECELELDKVSPLAIVHREGREREDGSIDVDLGPIQTCSAPIHGAGWHSTPCLMAG
jgi:hypothetical protein